jgi:hypothetical protein
MKFYKLVGGELVAVGIHEWAAWMALEHNRVGRWQRGDVVVSTVFTGIDHGWGLDATPRFFETMIFGGVHDLWRDRYSTLEQARAGHANVVKALEAGTEPWHHTEVGSRV